MTWSASVLIAKGWWQARRSWWLGVAVTLVIVQTMLLAVVGAFGGVDQATEERVEAFFTGDQRWTLNVHGAAPGQYWNASETTALEAHFEAQGTAAAGRLESQFLLGRRSLVATILEEDEQIQFQAPGTAAQGREFYSLGIVTGLASEDSLGWKRLESFALPGATRPVAGEVVELWMSVAQFARFAGSDRAAFASWPPEADELGRLHFEMTAARLTGNGSALDVVRAPAQVVGLFDTGLDAIDTFAVVTHRDSLAQLLRVEPGASNVWLSQQGNLDWPQGGAVAEDADAFSARYIGQMVDVLAIAGAAVAVLSLMVPAFLVYQGISSLLEAHRREYAVCWALGMPQATVFGAAGVLSFVLVSGTLIMASVMAWLLNAFALPALDLPLPVRLHFGVRGLAAFVIVNALAWLVALVMAARRDIRGGRIGSIGA